MKEECLDRIIPIGEGHFRRALSEFVAHYHRERNHQGLENALIEGARVSGAGRVHRQPRLGGLLNFYRRAAWSAAHRFGWVMGQNGLSRDAEPDRRLSGASWYQVAACALSRGKIDARIAERSAAVDGAKAHERAMENRVRLAVQEAYVRAKSPQDRATLLRTTVLPQSQQTLKCRGREDTARSRFVQGHQLFRSKTVASTFNS
jgi:hypothetical protein